MRLVPIKDSENDFAPVAISVEAARLKFQKNNKNLSSNNLSFSFFMWLFCVTIIPVIVYSQFGESWTEKFIELINNMK
jgi:hypothetical protein